MGMMIGKTSPKVMTRPIVGRTPLLGSDQQEAGWESLLSSESNQIMESLAGTGKSTYCREAIWRLKEKDHRLSIAYVAFNKSIADEFQRGLPPGTSATTMNSYGYSILREHYPHLGRTELNPRKVTKLAYQFIPGPQNERRIARKVVKKIVDLMKSMLIQDFDQMSIIRLAVQAGYFFPWHMKDDIARAVKRIMEIGRNDFSTIDFNDQIWLPVIHQMACPKLDWLLVDEAQDLSPLQHRFVMMLAGGSPLVIVGDPNQAIYGFRGADTHSMGNLAKRLEASPRGLNRFGLTKTRRCPKTHVEVARLLVPQFESFPDAADGTLDYKSSMLSMCEPGTMVLSRVNAPLMGLAYWLTSCNVPVAIQGKDLGDGLIDLIVDLKADSVDDLRDKIVAATAREMAELRSIEDTEAEQAVLNDRSECLFMACDGADTVDGVIERIGSLFLDMSVADQNCYVMLSSVHKAKGREARRVIITETDKMPHPAAKTSAQLQQEENIAYVAQTRSKDFLGYHNRAPVYFRPLADLD